MISYSRALRDGLAAIAVAVLLSTGVSAYQQQAPAQVSYSPIPAGTYKVDPAHSVIGFSIRHFELSWVSGRFKDFTGTIVYDDQDAAKSSVEFTAKIESVDTGIGKRDDHLRTADFFDAAKYPEMRFKSVRVESKGKGEYVAHGDLTIKDVTKRIALPFTLTGAVKDQRGTTRLGVDATTTINRLDYAVGQNAPMPSGGFAIGNEVRVEISLEAIRQEAQPAQSSR